MIPYVSVIVGGIAAYALGVIWYMVLANPWMKATKLTREDISASSANGINTSMIITYGVTFLLWLAASFILQAHLLPIVEAAGASPFRAVVGMWISFALLSTVLSTLYGMRGKALILIDAGYVLGGMLLITAAFTFLGR